MLIRILVPFFPVLRRIFANRVCKHKKFIQNYPNLVLHSLPAKVWVRVTNPNLPIVDFASLRWFTPSLYLLVLDLLTRPSGQSSSLLHNCNYFLSSEQAIVRIDVAQAFDLTHKSCPPRDDAAPKFSELFSIDFSMI